MIFPAMRLTPLVSGFVLNVTSKYSTTDLHCQALFSYKQEKISHQEHTQKDE